MSETHDHAGFSEDCLKILKSFELPDIHGVAFIQTDQQIRGHISWLHAYDASEALKVMHEIIAFARRQAKDVNEVKESILHGDTRSLLAGDVNLVQILFRWLEKRSRVSKNNSMWRM